MGRSDALSDAHLSGIRGKETNYKLHFYQFKRRVFPKQTIMGLSTSILNEEKSNLIKERTQAELNNFASVYRKQYTLAFLSHVHDQLVQRKQDHPQLLKQKDPPKEEEVIYGDNLLYFEENRKWKERFAVVRANYCLECYDSYEAFMKSKPPLFKLLLTGGTILTTEEKYMALVNKCPPDTDNVKQILAPPVIGMPGQFPVYLRMPYQKDHYFCLLKEAKQTKFISILSDCIRHQNQDFLKKKTYEVKAFVKAVQLYRQEKGHYESWEMLIGTDVQVLANVVMEDLLPSIEKDWLPHLNAKKREKKKRWFATVDASYNLVHETLKGGMMALINECRETAQKQSALMSSDMDQIMSSRAFLESKLRATVAESAIDYCMQNVEPNLPAVLEEIMGPISLGFKEARQLSESMMEKLYQTYQEGMTKENLQQALAEMNNLNLQRCYDKVSELQNHIQELQQSFSYPNWKGLEHSTQIDIQQVMRNMVYTFELLLNKAPQDSDLADAMVKAKNRVLKQYDYDSSTLRKKIFQEALLDITLPSIKAHLAPTFKEELPHFEQLIFADYVTFISVENVYEDILQQLLEKEVSKVVKEAASMQKHNLFSESRYNFSVSSLHHTPPGSPAFTSASKIRCFSMPPSSFLSLIEIKANDEKSIRTIEKAKAVEPESTVAQQVDVQAQAHAELSETQQCPNADEGHKDAVLENHVEMIAGPAAVMEETFANAQNLNNKMHTETEPSLVDDIKMVNSSSVNTTPALTTTPHTLAETVPNPVETSETPAEPRTSTTTESSAIACSSLVLQTVSDEPSISSGDAVGPTSVGAPTQDFSNESSLITEEEAVVRADKDEPLEVIVGPEPDIPKEPVMVICEGIKDSDVCVTNGCIDPKNEAVSPLDCIKQIRDLVVEVIEVEELIQPSQASLGTF